jgi:hypothetical protein
MSKGKHSEAQIIAALKQELNDPPSTGLGNSKPAALGAIGGDQAGNILGIVYGPQPMKAGIALIQMDSSSNGFDIGRIALPATLRASLLSRRCCSA